MKRTLQKQADGIERARDRTKAWNNRTYVYDDKMQLASPHTFIRHSFRAFFPEEETFNVYSVCLRTRQLAV